MAAKITQVSDIKEITLERMNEELFDPTLDFNEKALITNIRERLDAIPIANNSMTSDERRPRVIEATDAATTRRRSRRLSQREVALCARGRIP